MPCNLHSCRISAKLFWSSADVIAGCDPRRPCSQRRLLVRRRCLHWQRHYSAHFYSTLIFLYILWNSTGISVHAAVLCVPRVSTPPWRLQAWLWVAPYHYKISGCLSCTCIAGKLAQILLFQMTRERSTRVENSSCPVRQFQFHFMHPARYPPLPVQVTPRHFTVNKCFTPPCRSEERPPEFIFL